MRPAIIAVVFVALQHGTARADRAEELHADGQFAYDRADYAVAIERWEEAFWLSRAPGLLFNIGQAHRLSGDCARALSSYRQFVAADPASERRALTDELVRELETQCPSPSPPAQGPGQPESRRPEITDARHELRVAGLVTGGAGAALVATGLLLGHRASSIGDDVSAACALDCDWSAQRDRDSRGRRYATIGHALDAVGLVAVATGVILYVLGNRDRAVVTVAPRPHAGGALVTWSGSW